MKFLKENPWLKWVIGIAILVVAAGITLSGSSAPEQKEEKTVAEAPVTSAPVESGAVKKPEEVAPTTEQPAQENEESVLTEENKEQSATESEKPEEVATPAVINPKDKVLARIEGTDITEQDLLDILQAMGPQGISLYMNPESRQAVLGELISRRLLVLEAEKAKLDEAEEFKSIMSEIRTRTLAQMAAREIVKDVQVSAEDIRKYYDEHTELFMLPERIHARHILLSDDAASADNIAKVQAGLKYGIAFEDIARENSICPSAPEGGDLGEFQRGQMVPEFEEAAFALKEPGDISEPVKTQFGWHIIKLEGRVPAEPMEFERVQFQLLQNLQNQRTNEVLGEKLDELRKVYKVEMLEPAVDEKGEGGDKTIDAEAEDVDKK